MRKGNRVLVTAALPYSNGRLHVGHIAGAYLPSNIYVRYLRAAGVDVRYVCGSDDHGVAIMLTAQREGRSPAETARHYGQKQKEAFEGMGIHFDIYGGTSHTPQHIPASQDLFLSMYRKGFFEKQVTKQFFDEKQKMFLPDRFVKGSCGYCNAPEQNGDQCENCGKMLDVDTLQNPVSVMSGTTAVVHESAHWFLDLSRFERQVSAWLTSATIRDHTRRYVQGLLSTGLVKRAMTRDLSWGVPVPLDDPDAKNKVLYVWFDAPIGYISNTMQLCQQKEGDAQRYSDWWRSNDCDIFHFIGEDNTIFHCVIWIAMLSAEGGYQLPRGVIVNQNLNIQFPDREVEKISKSRGTAVWIDDYLSQGGNPDVLRYYLTCVAPEGARTVFKSDDLIQRNNSELANVLGNFVHRVASFTTKYVGHSVPAIVSAKVSDSDRAFRRLVDEAHANLTNCLENFEFKRGLETIMELCRAGNRYVDEKAPWVTRKNDMEATKVTLWHGLHAIRFLAVALAPYLPFSAEKIAHMLSLTDQQRSWSSATTPLPEGQSMQEPEILFTKIEVSEKQSS